MLKKYTRNNLYFINSTDIRKYSLRIIPLIKLLNIDKITILS